MNKKIFVLVLSLSLILPIVLAEDVTLSIGTVDTTTKTVAVEMINTEIVKGFQFTITGVTPSSASGGVAADNEFIVSASSNTGAVLGFSLTNTLPVGADLVTNDPLTIISYNESTNDQVCLTNYEGKFIGVDNQPLSIEVTGDGCFDLSDVGAGFSIPNGGDSPIPPIPGDDGAGPFVVSVCGDLILEGDEYCDDTRCDIEGGCTQCYPGYFLNENPDLGKVKFKKCLPLDDVTPILPTYGDDSKGCWPMDTDETNLEDWLTDCPGKSCVINDKFKTIVLTSVHPNIGESILIASGCCASTDCTGVAPDTCYPMGTVGEGDDAQFLCGYNNDLEICGEDEGIEYAGDGDLSKYGNYFCDLEKGWVFGTPGPEYTTNKILQILINHKGCVNFSANPAFYCQTNTISKLVGVLKPFFGME